MGMFNSIYADLRCPLRKEITKDTEIQIKWQAREARVLDVYRLGDTLDQIEEEYDNTWTRTDYICSACSRHTMGRDGMRFIRTADQSRHYVFVRIENGKIAEILPEEEFEKVGVTKFVDYL